MRLADSVHLAALAVYAKRTKAFLNVLGIVIGISSVIIIMTIGKGGQTAVMNQLDRFGINAVSVKPSPGKGGWLSNNDADYLKSVLTGASCVLPVYTNTATLSRGGLERDAFIWGVGAGFEHIFPAQTVSGRLFTESDVKEKSRVAVIELSLAERLFGTANAQGKDFVINANSGSYEFTVLGVISSASKTFDEAFGDSVPAFVYMPHTTAMSLYGAQALDYISIKSADSADLDRLGIRAARVLERKKDEKGAYYAENFTRQKERLSGILDIFTFIVGAAAAISLIVGGLGVMNLMLMSVSERTCEIGVMKAIGASGRDIWSQFLLEAVFITLCGGALGLGLGMCGAYVLTLLAGLPYTFDAKSAAFAIFFSIAMGVIFGVYPARKAAALNPIEALRRE